ncbi:antitoxin [Clostridia bacterium]|nr:antitoxin [Clostridia bacterium]
MDKGDFERLKHMRRYCEDVNLAILRFGNSFETFIGDTDYFNSVSMSIMQIGELSKGLSDEFKNSTRAQMPWGIIRGMRNRFAHGYDTMDEGEIWKTATKDIPILLNFCNSVIERQTAEEA